MTDSNNKKYEIAVIDMYDYGQAHGHRTAETLEDALNLARGIVLGSVDWSNPGCGYKQWLSFGEDVLVTSRNAGERVKFSGGEEVRQRCLCEDCQLALTEMRGGK